MNDRELILSLTRVAFLNSLTLSFLSIQYVFPISFVVSLWVVPVIFAIEILLTDPRHFLLSVTFMSGLGFVFFGLATGCWVIVYLCIGSVIGVAFRLRVYQWLRILSGIMAYAVALIGILATFLYILGLQLTDVGTWIGQFLPGVSWISISLTALLVSAIILVSVIDFVVVKVHKQLSSE